MNGSRFLILKAWISLSRPPFHFVGLLPFLLGGIIAWNKMGYLYWDIAILGTLGVFLIMLSTYFAGEYWDYLEDSYSFEQGSSRFTGGSQVIQRGLIQRRAALKASIITLTLALCVLLILQFVLETGPWTLLLGMLGVTGGFFYSSKPVRWVSMGIGEVWIALCYGWLPIAASFYIQTGYIHPTINLIALPVSLSIFNVIIMNEFPDYSADEKAGKNNLVVRLGERNASRIYLSATILQWITVALNIIYILNDLFILIYSPIFLLSLYLSIMMVKGVWRQRDRLETMCGLNILVNIGTTSAYILANLLW